ncbi:MAG: host-nuclease inhibitor Gam family protein [Alphaproteobacteria bacterium]
MSGIEEVDRLTQAYATSRLELSEKMDVVKQELLAVKRRYLRSLRGLADKALAARSDLASAIDGGRALFDKPRTRVLHGVKVGLQKGKGSIEIDDPANTIKLIRKHMNSDTADLLIKVSESLNRAALNELEAADLKRIGVRIAGGGDELVIRPVDGEIEKLVDALLEGADEKLQGEKA